MFQGAGIGPFERALSGNSDWVTYAVNPDWTLEEIGRDTKHYTVASDLKQVGVDEFNLAWEQMIRNKAKTTPTPALATTRSIGIPNGPAAIPAAINRPQSADCQAPTRPEANSPSRTRPTFTAAKYPAS